jgi:uncharacterized protein involved in high-affinity Fe2+ transport
MSCTYIRRMRTSLPLVALATAFCVLEAGGAGAVVIGGPLLRDGLEIVPSYQTGVQVDRIAAPEGSIHLEASIHATAGEAHGFPVGAWMPYLTVNYALTRDDNPTFKKSGLLYPMTSKDGPHYAAAAQLAGPGTYNLTYIISPPTSHGMLRHTDKASGVGEWWKPVTGTWTFTYPSPK